MGKGVVFGLKCGELFASYDQDGFLLRMSQLSLIEGEKEYCTTLPKQGMMQNGKLYQQEMLEQDTLEKECGLLPTEKKYPTPCAGNWKDTIGTLKGRIGTPHEENTIARVLYKDEILSYPTPTATNIMGEQSERVERNQSGGFILRKKNKPHMTYGARLQDAVMYLHKQLPKEEQSKILKDKITEMENLESKPLKSLKMNPDWIEWLMGYPKKWTDITIESKDLEMQSYHKSHTNLEKE